jgi:hypothetical protein
MRHIGMVRDLERYRGTMLVWAAMGGGSISLPYLEQEAFGAVPPRLRFYGYMNDSEFIAECKKRGIKVFGIVFEVQGWEFPMKKGPKGFTELNISIDKTGGEDASWYGLREFSNGEHAELFPTSLKDYYPEGIINSDGEIVTDLWEEGAARTYKGDAVHAGWVECPDNGHQAYQMCRNNPVWRDYLKKIIKIMIDAGVDGIQLDEAELPITSLKAGGCFCKDCRKQFREFLKEIKTAGKLDAQWANLNLDSFDYKDFINKGGHTFPDGAPLFREYYEFQIRAVKKHFIELADYIRSYGREKGREILVSGNFFNCMPVYYPFEHTVDVVITEMESTLFRQPHWYRYINGFSGGKPVIVAENPYGGVIPELLKMLDNGKGYDLFRILLAEASVYGCNMSVPYGGWMGSVIEDAFYPPPDVTEEFQTFLADHEGLFAKKSGSKTAVVYSFPSYYWRECIKSYTGNVERKPGEGMLFYHPTDLTDEHTTRLPFWEILKEITGRQVIADVLIFGGGTPFGDLCADNVAMDTLKGYELLILPDCPDLTENQIGVLNDFAHNGGRIVVSGETPLDLTSDNIIKVENKDTKRAALDAFNAVFDPIYETVNRVSTDAMNVGWCTHGNNIWLLNYNYDSSLDRVLPVEKLKITVKGVRSGRVHMLGGGDYETAAENGVFTLENVPILTILEVLE